MFLKKLFGISSSPATPPAAPSEGPLPQWRNPDWVKFSYPTRYGQEACAIQVDLRYETERPAEWLHCVRVLLPLPPAQQDARALPLESAAASIKAAEDGLVRALSAQQLTGMLVATLQYEGWQEWVFMLPQTHGLDAAIAAWTAKTPQPGLQVWQTDGWHYYEEALAPTPLDRINIQGGRHIAELIAQGTNKDANHWLTHRFTGSPASLEALRRDLITREFHVVAAPEGQLHASKACPLTIAGTELSALKVHALAHVHDATYTGWSTFVVKETWLNGAPVKDGVGELLHNNGALYKGNFKNGVKHGKGWIRFSDGSIYEGDWLEGKRTGKGVLQWSPTESYHGDFKDNELHGQGEYRYASGNVFSGGWQMGVREGLGSFNWVNSGHYYGEWTKDKRTGYGRYTYTSPVEWYEGGFLNGELHGKGYDFYEKQKRIRYATWNANKFVEEHPLPDLPPDLLQWEEGAEGEDPGARIQAHIAHAQTLKRIPMIYLKRAESPASHYLRPYHVLKQFHPFFAQVAVLELPFGPGLVHRLGCSYSAHLLRLDDASGKMVKSLDQPVWFDVNFEFAAQGLQELLG